MKVLDIAIKDMIRSIRSLFVIGMTLVVPLLLTGLIYFAFGGATSGEVDLPVLKIGVVNLDAPPADQPALGNLLVDMLKDPSVLNWLNAVTMTDENSARAAVDSQEIGMAIFIPTNFTTGILSGDSQTNLVLVQDPTLTIDPLVVENMVNSFLDGIRGAKIAMEVTLQRGSTHGVALDTAAQQTLVTKYQEWYTNYQRNLYHSAQATLITKTPASGTPEGENQGHPMKQILGFIMAGQLIFFSFYTGSYAMMSILREEEEGTLARLFTTPTNRTAILTGKFLAVVLTVIGQALVLILAGQLVFGVRWGQPMSVVLMTFGLVIVASGLGVFLISLVKNARQAGPVMGGVLTILGMLGGLFTVAVQMPAGFNTITLFTPHGWVMRGWKLVMAGNPPGDLILPLLVILTMGIILFFIGAAIFRRRVES